MSERQASAAISSVEKPTTWGRMLEEQLQHEVAAQRALWIALWQRVREVQKPKR
jgi:hypothetical protein